MEMIDKIIGIALEPGMSLELLRDVLYDLKKEQELTSKRIVLKYLHASSVVKVGDILILEKGSFRYKKKNRDDIDYFWNRDIEILKGVGNTYLTTKENKAYFLCP